MPDAYMGLMIFFKPVGDAAPAPDPNQLNTVFSGTAQAAATSHSDAVCFLHRACLRVSLRSNTFLCETQSA